MPGSGRAMALEAGSAMHDVFAAVRLYDLAIFQQHQDHTRYHGSRLFGEDRWRSISAHIPFTTGHSEANLRSTALEALYTSGFHDDPFDSRRTVANLEEASIEYVDRWPLAKHPIWVRDIQDPTSNVGIEVPFELVLTFQLSTPKASGVSPPVEYPYTRVTVGEPEVWVWEQSYRFIGRMDGLHLFSGRHLEVQENKTAARLNDGWKMSFEMSHQVTGYMIAASIWLQAQVEHATVIGLQIPQPKRSPESGLVRLPLTRRPHQFADFFRWFYDTVQVWEKYRENIFDAPQFTHSCNRYFRPCNMIPFCVGDMDEKQQILTEMEPYEWSPIDAKVSD